MKITIVGGEEIFGSQAFAQKLVEQGNEVVAHFAIGDRVTHIPPETEKVLFLKDSFREKDVTDLQSLCETAGVPLVRVSRRWASALPTLVAEGLYIQEAAVSRDNVDIDEAAADYIRQQKAEGRVPSLEEIISYLCNITDQEVEPRMSLWQSKAANQPIKHEVDIRAIRVACTTVLEESPHLATARFHRQFEEAVKSLSKPPHPHRWPSALDRILSDEARVERESWTQNDERRLKAYRTWARGLWVAYKEGGAYPGRTLIGQESKRVFGQPVHHRYTKQARVDVFGEWAEKLSTAAKLKMYFEMQTKGLEPPHSLESGLEAGVIQGVKSERFWYSSTQAIDEYAASLREAPVENVAQIEKVEETQVEEVELPAQEVNEVALKQAVESSILDLAATLGDLLVDAVKTSSHEAQERTLGTFGDIIREQLHVMAKSLREEMSRLGVSASSVSQIANEVSRLDTRLREMDKRENVAREEIRGWLRTVGSGTQKLDALTADIQELVSEVHGLVAAQKAQKAAPKESYGLGHDALALTAAVKRLSDQQKVLADGLRATPQKTDGRIAAISLGDLLALCESSGLKLTFSPQ